MSCRTTKPTKWCVHPGAKTQISLGIHTVGSESSLSAWRSIGSLAPHKVHREGSDQTGRMPRLIWVRWVHRSFCWFCHAAAHISIRNKRQANCFKSVDIVLILTDMVANYILYHQGKLHMVHIKSMKFLQKKTNELLEESMSRKQLEMFHFGCYDNLKFPMTYNGMNNSIYFCLILDILTKYFQLKWNQCDNSKTN